mmetsp:Transcript_64101/g.164956  ORF Transcript_64101/g.164956 Transcript_64101/m.164956 type:complete len:255 (+) Transcript_64101:128-892(+)
MKGAQVRKAQQRLEDVAVRRWDCSVCCLGRGAGSPLSSEERGVLWELRYDHCNAPFDARSSETERQLKDIWNTAYPEEAVEAVHDSKRWRCLGFQGDNPCTDVRSGRFVLDQLHYMVSTYPERTKELVRQAADLDYPFAISCFNVSHLLVVFFDLCNTETFSPVPLADRADAVQLKNFTALCRSSPHGPRGVLDELTCALVERLHETWKDMRVSQNCNLMDFPKAMRRIYDINATFWSTYRSEIAELRVILTMA